MKKISTLLSLLLVALNLSAGPIGEQRARQIAEEFFAEHTTRSVASLTLEWAGDIISEPTHIGNKLDNSLIYIYNRGTSNGFVIVAGEDNYLNPIIAYSFDTSFDKENMSEATRDILDAWCKEVKDARKAQRPISSSTQSATRASDELLYQTAIWNQYEPYNREAPVYNGSRSVTGCVATALSIICYHNRWPEKGVGTTPAYSYYDNDDIERTVPKNVLGRKYDYDNMLMEYNSYNDTQANAVAALMKDMGTAVKMMYHPNGSGAYDIDIIPALTQYFGFSKRSKLAFRDGYPTDEWNEMMRENLREYGPTYYSGGSDTGGHAFVVDGYAPKDYFHFNFGWGGVGNGYFRFPEIAYYDMQISILYLEPDRSGTTEYRDNLLLFPLVGTDGVVYYRGISTDATNYKQGEFYYFGLGGILNVGPRQFNGEAAIVHCDKNGAWKKKLYTMNLDGLDIYNYSYKEEYFPLAITEPIEVGDRIRVYFKSYDSDVWEWARLYILENGCDEILLKATPAEVAKSLKFGYRKNYKCLTIESANALQYELLNATTLSTIDSGEVQAFESRAIMVDSCAPGEYIIKVASGGEPYILNVKL